MDAERIVKYCQKKIKDEEQNNPMFATDKIQAYKDIIDYIRNANKPRENELQQVKDIFLKYWTAYIMSLPNMNGKKAPRFIFTSTDDNNIKKKLIPLMKETIATYEDDFGSITLADFFERFMQNYPDWWKKHNFHISTIARHYQKIFTAIMQGNSDKMKKATVQNVVADYTVKLNLEKMQTAE